MERVPTKVLAYWGGEVCTLRAATLEDVVLGEGVLRCKNTSVV